MSKGIDFDQLFPGRFLKAGDFQGKDVTLTISAIDLEELPSQTGGTKVKGILTFHNVKKKLVLNRTNGECLKAMFGRDTGEWIGKRITLYPAHIEYEGSDLAIRVRGSPDLKADLPFQLQMPRRKPVTVTMVKTGAPAAGKKAHDE
jgi:hypothetical protein